MNDVKGDVRMYKSVQAKLHNPELSLQEALNIGGFVFIHSPTIESGNRVKDTSLRDRDGICMSQRKNQLRRRLRLLGVGTEMVKKLKQCHNPNDEKQIHGSVENIILNTLDSSTKPTSSEFQEYHKKLGIGNHMTYSYSMIDTQVEPNVNKEFVDTKSGLAVDILLVVITKRLTGITTSKDLRRSLLYKML